MFNLLKLAIQRWYRKDLVNMFDQNKTFIIYAVTYLITTYNSMMLN